MPISPCYPCSALSASLRTAPSPAPRHSVAFSRAGTSACEPIHLLNFYPKGNAYQIPCSAEEVWRVQFFLHQVSHRSISFEGFSSQCTSQLHLGKPVPLGLAIRNLHSKLTTLTFTSPHVLPTMSLPLLLDAPEPAIRLCLPTGHSARMFYSEWSSRLCGY